ncbi:MAG: energy transducer TonB [Bdellovibrionales bacterium]|nr:energy transducer TonB [Bdellovibrionales bacterium]
MGQRLQKLKDELGRQNLRPLPSQTEGLALAASMILHLLVFTALSFQLFDQGLLVGSIKGSPDAGGAVAFEVIELPEPQKPTLPQVEEKMLDQSSEVVVTKKKIIETKPQLRKPKTQKKPEMASAKSNLKSDQPGREGLLGFDLQNVKGNLSPELQRYFTELRMDIERRKKYPKLAKRLRQSGRVILKFEIGKSGKIENVYVDEPSPFKALNDSAKKLLTNLKGEYPLPSAIKAERIEVKLPVSYRL